MLTSLLSGLEGSSVVALILTSPPVYAAVNALHIVGLGVLIGSIMTLDLRVLGIWKGDGWREAVLVASPIAAAGLAVAVASGVILFCVRPLHYLDNQPFLIKIGLLLTGLVNAAVFHYRLRRMARTNPDAITRVGALVSVLAWVAAIFAGRFIAFSE